jgi:hypothetical protein
MSAATENKRGGEARDVVAAVATLLGIELSHDVLGGGIWSTENMRRVVRAVETLNYDNRRLKGLPERGFAA